MGYDPQKRRHVVSTESRDAKGHFVPKSAPVAEPEVAADASPTNMDPAAPQAVKPPVVPPKNYDPSLDAPLVSVAVNNPFKRILHWWDDMRRRQTTRLSWKVSAEVPLITTIAIVTVLVAPILVIVFGVGIKIGQVQITRELLSHTQTTANAAAIVVSRSGEIREIAPSRYILTGKDGQMTSLSAENLLLAPYLNQRLLITGLYDLTTNTLKIRSPDDIEIIP